MRCVCMILIFLLATVWGHSSRVCAQQRQVIVVVGAPGEEPYARKFQVWAERWQQAAQEAGNSLVTIGLETSTSPESAESENAPEQNSDTSDRDRLRKALLDHASTDAPEQLWLILIGHGTFDGKTAKFNLKGPDVSGQELKTWLDPGIARSSSLETVDQIIINCASSSSPFIPRLSAPGRIIVTATQHEMQFNFSRFGEFLSQEVVAQGRDLDKDQRTSLLEWVLAASSKTQEFYRSEDRLATELALIDDNGDGAGTPTDWFTGIRVNRQAQDKQPDGLRTNQVFFSDPPEEKSLSAAARQRRDQLEAQIEALRQRKNQISEDAYLDQLEPLAIELARLYEGN